MHQLNSNKYRWVFSESRLNLGNCIIYPLTICEAYMERKYALITVEEEIGSYFGQSMLTSYKKLETAVRVYKSFLKPSLDLQIYSFLTKSRISLESRILSDLRLGLEPNSHTTTIWMKSVVKYAATQVA